MPGFLQVFFKWALLEVVPLRAAGSFDCRAVLCVPQKLLLLFLIRLLSLPVNPARADHPRRSRVLSLIRLCSC
jgi:hypothetical protein